MPKEDEIVICEETKSGCLPRYKLQKGSFGTILTYADSQNRIQLGYPFQILSWALPVLLEVEYKGERTLEVSPENLEKVFRELVTGSLFSSNKPLEVEIMKRYKKEFPAEYKKHFG